MDLVTTYDISLDLIRNNYVAIRIKQYDKNSRKVIIHCTANGQEYQLDETIRALIQVKKSDGFAVANDCEIDTENNTVIATITQQMSTSAGVCLADVSLYNVENDQVLGTMKFNIVTDSNAVTREDIVSSSEFNTIADLVIIGREKVQELIELMERVENTEADYAEAERIRQENESARQLAETSRSEAEAIRVESENLRSAAETKRTDAENLRISAEEQRVENENARKASESERIQSESERKTAETSRIEEEKKRVAAEALRKSAETARDQAESLRATAEAERIKNEEARKLNETNRDSAESARASAETARSQAESARASAESKRDSSEKIRISSEESRNTAEAARVEAENIRKENENGRVSAESQRETDTALAIQGCNDIKRVIESKLENGEFNGNTVLLGSNEPSPDMGKDGDIYIEVAGIGSYPHYLFTKGNGYWTPQWTMRGLNGRVVDSLLSDSVENAPSVRAVNEGLANKVIDNLNGSETNVAPSVRSVKEKLNTKSDNIMQLTIAGAESKNVKLGFKKLVDSNVNNVQILDRNGNVNMYPVTLWDLINNKPSLATLTNGKLPIANIPYSPLDFKDVGGNLALDVTVQNLTFELWGVSKKISYTSEYEAGKYVKIGNIIFFSFYWKGSVKEAGEYARVKMNVLDLYPPLIEMSVVVSQWTFILSGSPVDITGTVTQAPNPRLVVAHTNGGPAAIWGTGTGQYFKASGCYITG